MPGEKHLESALRDNDYKQSEIFDVGKNINDNFDKKLRALRKEAGKEADKYELKQALEELQKLDESKHAEIQAVLEASRGELLPEKYTILGNLHANEIWQYGRNKEKFNDIFNVLTAMGMTSGAFTQTFESQKVVIAKALQKITEYQKDFYSKKQGADFKKSSLDKISFSNINEPTTKEVMDAIFQYQSLEAVFRGETRQNQQRYRPDLYGDTKVRSKQFKMDNVASLQTLTAIFEDLQHIQEKAIQNPIDPVNPENNQELKDEKEMLDWLSKVDYFSLDNNKATDRTSTIDAKDFATKKTVDVSITYKDEQDIMQTTKLRYNNQKKLVAIDKIIKGKLISSVPELTWLSKENTWYKGANTDRLFIQDPTNESKVIYAPDKEYLTNTTVIEAPVDPVNPLTPEKPNNSGKTTPDVPTPNPEKPDDKKTEKPEDKKENPDAPVEIKPENLGTKVEGINEAENMNDYLRDWLKDMRVSDFIPTAEGGYERKLYKVGSDRTHYELGTLKFDKDKNPGAIDATLNIFRAEDNQDDLIAVFDLKDGKCKLETIAEPQAKKLAEDDKKARELLQKIRFKGAVVKSGIFIDAVDFNESTNEGTVKVKPGQIRQSENGLYILTLNNSKKTELTIDPAADFKSFTVMNNDLLNLPTGESYTPNFDPKTAYVENNGKIYKLKVEIDQAKDYYELQFEEVLAKEKPEILYNKKEIATTVKDASNTMGSKSVTFRPGFESQSLNGNMLTLNNSGGVALTSELELEKDAKGEFVKVKNNEHEISSPDFFDPNTLHKRGFDKSETLGLDRSYFESNFFTNATKHVDGDIKGIRIKANGTERFYTAALDGTEQNQGKLKLDLVPQDTENQKIMERMLYVRTFLDKIEEVLAMQVNNPDGIGELSGTNETSKEKFGFRPIPKDPEKYKDWIANHVIFEPGFKEEDVVNKDFSKIKLKNDIKFSNSNSENQESQKSIVFTLDKDANIVSALQEGQTENGTLELADPDQKYFTYMEGGKLLITTESREVKEPSHSIDFNGIKTKLAPEFRMEEKREKLVLEAVTILEKTMNKETVLTPEEKTRFEDFWKATTKDNYLNPNAQKRFDRVYDALRGGPVLDKNGVKMEPDTRVDADKNINALLKNNKSQYTLDNGKLVGPDAGTVNTGTPPKAPTLSSNPQTPNAVPQTNNNVDKTLEVSKDPNREEKLRSTMNFSNAAQKALANGFGLTEQELQDYIVAQATPNDPDNITKWKNVEFMKKEIEERIFTADKIRTLTYRIDRNTPVPDTGKLFASKQDALDWFVASPTLAKKEPIKIEKQEIILGNLQFEKVPFVSNYNQRSLEVGTKVVKDKTSGKEYGIKVFGNTCNIFEIKK